MKNLTSVVFLAWLIGSVMGGDEPLKWQWRSPRPQGSTLNDVVWNGSRFVAVGILGVILISEDGSSWERVDSGTGEQLNRIIWNGSRFVVVGNNGLILTSSGGRTWNPLPSGVDVNLNAIVASPAGMVVVGDQSNILSSAEGETWDFFHGGLSHVSLRDIVWNGVMFVAVGTHGTVLTSRNADFWRKWDSKTSEHLRSLAWNGSVFLAVGDNKTALTSVNGEWQAIEAPRELHRVMWAGSRFLALGNSGWLLAGGPENWQEERISPTSDLKGLATGPCGTVTVGEQGVIFNNLDDKTWTRGFKSLTDLTLNGIGGNEDGLLAVGGNWLMRSRDGLSWSKQQTPYLDTFRDAAWGDGLYVVVGNRGFIMRSEDGGLNWRAQDRVTSKNLKAVVANADTGHFVAVGRSGTILSSSDGRSWSEEWTPDEAHLESVIWANDLFITVGDRGAIWSSLTGTSWEPAENIPEIYRFNDVACGESRYVAVGNAGVLFTSEDGKTWSRVLLDESDHLHTITWNGSMFVVTGSGFYLTSEDGKDWERWPWITDRIMNEIVWDGEKLIGISGGGTIIVGKDPHLPEHRADPEPHRLLYPWISDSARFESILVATNHGRKPVVVTLTARREKGQGIQEEKAGPFTIPAHGFLKRVASDLFPKLTFGSGYTVLLESSSDQLRGSWVTNNLDTPSGSSPSLGVAVEVPKLSQSLSQRAGHHLLLGYLPVSGGLTSGAVLVNTGERSTEVDLTFYDETGRVLETGLDPIILEPHLPFARVANDLLPPNAGDACLMAVSKTEPIVGVGFVFNEMGEPAIGNASVMGGACRANRTVFPWVSNSKAFESILVVNNLDDIEAEVTLTAQRATGPAETKITGIPPKGFYKDFASNIFPKLGSGKGYTVTLDCPNPRVFGRWVTNNLNTPSGRSPSQGVGVELPGAGSDRRAGQTILFSFLPVTRGLTSAPVVVNLGPEGTTVKTYFYDAGGNLVIEHDLGFLKPNRPFATVVNELLPPGSGDVSMVAVARSGQITGASFVFNGDSEPAIGNVTAIELDPEP